MGERSHLLAPFFFLLFGTHLPQECFLTECLVCPGLTTWLEEFIPSGICEIHQPLTNTLKRCLPPLQVDVALSIQIKVKI